MKKLDQLHLNKFKQPVYDPKNLINFERKSLWMVGVERVKFPLNGYQRFVIICGLIAAYFIFR